MMSARIPSGVSAGLATAEPEQTPCGSDRSAAMTTIAAAMRRKRAARISPEVRAKRVAKLQECADAALAAAPQVQIRALEAAHITAVLALNLDRLPGKVCTEALVARLQARAAHCFVATEVQHAALRRGSTDKGFGSGGVCDTAPVEIEGFILFESSQGSVDVVLLAVRSASERRGIGRALLSVALANAAAEGFHTASLSVRADNESAVRLYKSLGFAVRTSTISLESVDACESSTKTPAAAGNKRLTMQWCL